MIGPTDAEDTEEVRRPLEEAAVGRVTAGEDARRAARLAHAAIHRHSRIMSTPRPYTLQFHDGRRETLLVFAWEKRQHSVHVLLERDKWTSVANTEDDMVRQELGD